MNYDFDLYSPVGDHAEDLPYFWLGDLLIAVLIVAMCAAAYFWGTA